MRKLSYKNLNNNLFIIAEIGNNHEGNINVAKDIINNLENTGVSAVKFQSFTPELLSSSSDKNRLDRLKSFQLSLKEHYELKACAKKAGILFISTPCTEDWVKPLSEICDALKVASGDIDFMPTIQEVAKTNLPVIISTGTAEITEIDNTVEVFKSIRNSKSISDELFLMHCVAEYPANIEDTNLKSIPFMKDRYKLKVGWSNHVIGQLACNSAVALGADIIEVHVTDKKSGREFRDHELSFEPRELKNLCHELTQIKSSLGNFTKAPTQNEIQNKTLFRKGLIYKDDLAKGNIINKDQVCFSRPSTYFRSFEIEKVIGQKLNKNVLAGNIISPKDFE